MPMARRPRLVLGGADDEARVDLAVQAPHRDRRQHTFRRAARAHDRMNAGARHGGDDGRREIAVADQLDARAGRADVGDELLVARPVEHRDDQVVDVAAQRLGDRMEVVADRRVEIDRLAAGSGTISFSM